MGSFSIWHWALVALVVVIYFAPTMTASHRWHKNTGPIMLINLFLGWTLIGWLVALVWSMTDNTDDAGRIAAERKKKGLPSEAAVAPPSAVAHPAAASFVNELKTLSDLRGSGALSDDEFERAKAKLIG